MANIFQNEKYQDLKKLVNDYHDSSKDIFLHPNTTDILREVSKDSKFSFLTRDDIKTFERSLYEISRANEFRLLRGKRRHLSNRPWISFAPGKYPNYFDNDNHFNLTDYNKKIS